MFQEKNDAFNLFSIDYDVKNLIKITWIVSQEMNHESSKLFHQDEN